MGSTNDFSRFSLPDSRSNDYAIPYAFNGTGIAVAVGDLCYYKSQDATFGDIAFPADQLTSLGTVALDQMQFGALFVGVSSEQILLAETNKRKRFTVWTDQVCEFKCPSQTWKNGAPVGIFSSGSALDPQQVDALQDGGVALGVAVKDYPSATTRVRVRLLSRYAGIVPSGGIEPVGTLTQFGGSAFGVANGYFREEGNLFRASSAAATGLGANAADTTDDILGGIRLPAGVLDVAGRGLCITAQGKFGATANNKRFRIFLNPTMSGQTLTNGVYSNAGTVTAGTAAFDSGTQTGNNVGWSVLANLFKYGAAGSNTQYFQASPIYGATHGGIGLPSAQTLTESGTIDIIVTGASLTTGAVNDVIMSFLEINAMN